MIHKTLDEKAALHTAKEHHKEFVKKYPKRAQEERQAVLSQILDSEAPEWGGLLLKVSTKPF